MKSRDENKELNFIEEAARQLAGYDDASLLKEMEWAEREWELRKQTHPKEAEAEMQSADQSFRLLMERIRREAREGDAIKADKEARPKKITNPTDEKAAKEPAKTPNAAEETGDGPTGNLPGIMGDTRRITDDEGNASCVAGSEGSTAAEADGEGDIRCGADDERNIKMILENEKEVNNKKNVVAYAEKTIRDKGNVNRIILNVEINAGVNTKGQNVVREIIGANVNDIVDLKSQETARDAPYADIYGVKISEKEDTRTKAEDETYSEKLKQGNGIARNIKKFETYPRPIEEISESVGNLIDSGSSIKKHRSMKPNMMYRKGNSIGKKGLRRVMILTAAIVILGVGGMTPVARQGYQVAEYPEKYGSDRSYIVRNNTTVSFPESKVEEAYAQIEDAFNIKVLALAHLPKNMKFENFILTKNKGIIKFCYEGKKIYLEEKISDEKNTVSVLTMDRKPENTIKNDWLNKELYLKENILEEGIVEYSIQFDMNSVTYYLSGIMEKDEFIKVVENLYFWN